MKRIIIAICTVIAISSTNTFASYGISNPIVQSFITTFNDAKDISWDEYNGFSVATFVQNGVKRSAYYDQDGNLVVVGKQVEAHTLPLELKTKLEASFPEYSIMYLFEMEDANGKSYYATIASDKKIKIIKSGSKKWKSLRTKKK